MQCILERAGCILLLRVSCCTQVAPSAHLISTAHVPHVPRPLQLISCALPLCGDTPASSIALRSLLP